MSAFDSLTPFLLDTRADITLRTDAPDLWPAVGRITANERDKLEKITCWDAKVVALLITATGYNELIKANKDYEAKQNVRRYWIVDKQNHIAGQIKAQIHQDLHTAVISYFVFPSDRRKGFATGAVRGLVESLLAHNVVKHVCAETIDVLSPTTVRYTETDILNTVNYSKKILTKNKFEELGKGLCTTIPDRKHLSVSRFMRSKDQAKYPWPLAL